jgi:hypothetical protein
MTTALTTTKDPVTGSYKYKGILRRIEKWNEEKHWRVHHHVTSVQDYCVNKKPEHHKRHGMLAKSNDRTNEDFEFCWPTEDSKFTTLTAALIMQLPFQPHMLIVEFADWEGNYDTTDAPKRKKKNKNKASSLDLRGVGRTMSGAMSIADIRSFHAGTFPPLDYGYEDYYARVPRPSIGTVPMRLSGCDSDDSSDSDDGELFKDVA